MGVPGLFPFFQTKFPNYKTIIQPRKDGIPGLQKTSMDNVYLDGNAIIHKVAQYVFKYGDLANRETIESDSLDFNSKILLVYERFYDAMMNIYNRFENVKLLYIAMDGVCPLAKQSQQRQRRYTAALESSVLQTKVISEDSTFTDVPSFTSSMISPGTMFMYELNYYLRLYIADTRKNIPDLQIILDDSSNPGEGEHKIMDYIRNNHIEGTRHCIFSTDGDLLILCMSIHISGMYLMMDINNKNKMQVCLMDATGTTAHLAEEFGVDISKSSEEEIYRCIDDFTILSFLVGNDFFPKIKCLGKLARYLNDVVNTYTESIKRSTTRSSNIGRSTDNNTLSFRTKRTDNNIRPWKSHINIHGIYMFLYEYAKKEVDSIVNLANRPSHENIDSKTGKDLTDYSTKHFLSIKNGKTVFDVSGYRKFYYFKAFNPDRYNDCMIYLGLEDIKDDEIIKDTKMKILKTEIESTDVDIRSSVRLLDMCKNYIEMMVVIFYYYTDTIVSWNEMYRYHYPPMITDLVSYLELQQLARPRLLYELGAPTDPFVQLICILSPKHRYLLPKYFSNAMAKDSPLVKNGMIVDTFSIDYHGAEHEYKAIALVPFVDRSLVDSVYKEMVRYAGGIEEIYRLYPRNRNNFKY